MRRLVWVSALALASVLVLSPSAKAQPRPYIGYVYPAGGQQGTTFQIRLGGQGLDDVDRAVVSGSGVRAKVVEYYRRMNNQEMAMLREQLAVLKRATRGSYSKAGKDSQAGKDARPAPKPLDPATRELMDRIEKRMEAYVNPPACASICNLVFVEVTADPDAAPGPREIRLATPRGVSNPLVFCIDQFPEISRKPMLSASLQVLGKEELALRHRPDDEAEDHVSVPCVANGQIASGEINTYRFEARKGQHLVMSVMARQLIPFVADAVPGWFQPVLRLCDAKGKEVAYDDDFRFKPDPIIHFDVPHDGQYVLGISDAIYRGREDFVYRLTIAESPFVTSIFPLGGRVDQPLKIQMIGWNLDQARLTLPSPGAGPGIYPVTAHRGKWVSNRVPLALDTLDEGFDKEANNDQAHAQKVTLPLIVNGRIDRPDDLDVFTFTGKAGQTIVAEVVARRLESPLDSELKLTDASGNILAANDDYDDPLAGVNTHNADSYLSCKLPADGTYFVYLGDTARHGGPEYAYRLRLSQPEPDFALLTVPSSVAMRGKNTASLVIHVVRKDGFAAPITLTLKNPPAGFTAYPVTVGPNQAIARLNLKTTLVATPGPVRLCIEGRAKIGSKEIAHDAVAAEDRMQAFLWRHLVPAQDLEVLVYDPSYVPPPKHVRTTPLPATRPAPPEPPQVTPPKPPTGPGGSAVATNPPPKPKFSKRQVESRLREIKRLYDEGLLTDEFNDKKVEECEAGGR